MPPSPVPERLSDHRKPSRSPDEWLVSEERPPASREQGFRRRPGGEKPELEQEGKHIPDVPVLDVQRRKPKAAEGKDDKSRNPEGQENDRS